MILVMDVGNTNIKLGLYEGEEKVGSFKVATDPKRTGDEYGSSIKSLMAVEGIDYSHIDGIIMSSVAPALNFTLEHMCKFYFGVNPIVVGPGVKTGLNIRYETPQSLGSDRIVNAVGAIYKYGGPCIVVDFGTATTFSVISKDSEFVGGVICPGVKTSIDALTNTASKLPRIELVKPTKVIGKSTVTNMQSGLINGFVGLVKHLISLIKEELGGDDIKVVATGGMSELIAVSDDSCIDIIDRDLTLTGLRIIYNLNKQ